MDPVRDFLRRRQVGPHVIEGGLDWLVANWLRIAKEAAHAQPPYSVEWLNDMDTRQILQELFDNVREAGRARKTVERADTIFVAATAETADCQWGERNREEHGWTQEKNWWYWRKPTHGYLP